MSIDVGREVAAAPAAAWRLLADTRMWPMWGPTVRRVELSASPEGERDGDGDKDGNEDADSAHLVARGRRGRVVTPFGLALPFVITHVEAGHRWSWRVAGVPATGHRVEPTRNGCRVVFEVPTLLPAYVIVCRLALHRIEHLLVAPPDGPAGDSR